MADRTQIMGEGSMRIVRKDSGKNHWYVDLDAGGERVKGVTGIIGDGLPKQALINWAGNATAEYTLDNWDELAALSPAARLKKMQGGRYASRDEAANRGTQVHKMGERLIHGESVTVPDALRGHVNSYVKFLDEFQLRAKHVEALVYSESLRYCGQLDIYGDILLPDMPEYDHLPRDDDGFVCDCLIDAKTTRSGIFGETALQLAGYRFAEFMQTDPRDPDTAFAMPEVTWVGAVWIRADGYSLIPVKAEKEEHLAFRYVRKVGEFDKTSRDLIGDAIVPPTASRYRLITVNDDDPRPRPEASDLAPKSDAMDANTYDESWA